MTAIRVTNVLIMALFSRSFSWWHRSLLHFLCGIKSHYWALIQFIH